MNRDVAGFGGQMVTTWGADLEGTRWVGPDRPMKWVCTCRCGKTCGGNGYGVLSYVWKQDWVVFGEKAEEEAFCSLQCAVKYNKELVGRHFEKTVAKLEALRKYRDILLSALASAPRDD